MVKRFSIKDLDDMVDQEMTPPQNANVNVGNVFQRIRQQHPFVSKKRFSNPTGPDQFPEEI